VTVSEIRVVLVTPRLILREQTMDDLDDIAAFAADPEVMRYLGTGGVRTRDDAKEALEWMLERYAEDGFGLWATVEKATGRWIGRCGLLLHEIDGAVETEVAYALVRDAWGHGYATEAATAARDHATGALGRRRLICLIHHGNDASVNVATKLGMRFERDVPFRGITVAMYSLRAQPD
jgi:[ribosomal protein S5]-alanine N-acetyltransferase